MNKTSSISYFFRKSPVARALIWVVAAIAFIVVSAVLNIKIQQVPEIFELNPPVGSSGDVIVIRGNGFGKVRDTSYVEFGGTRLTSSAYLSWKNDEIQVVLPPNVQDGLVYVGNKTVRSKPSFFANATTVPVAVNASVQSILPIIYSVEPQKIYPGSLVKITGRNFGNMREKSKVGFSSARERFQGEDNASNDSLEYIFASDGDFDYVYWSDSEIRVHIPDGSISGVVFVETARGKSAQHNIEIDRRAGTKNFISPKNYVIQLSVDIEDGSLDKGSSVVIRVPRPFETAAQPSVKLIEFNAEPIISDYQHTVIHQMQCDKIPKKQTFTQNFAVVVYEVRTNVTASRLNAISSINKAILSDATAADDFTPASDPDIKELLFKIIGKETNPYNIAALVYNYMTAQYTVLENVRTGKISPLDLLSEKKGDPYDFAVIFTTLMRASGIPSYVDGGILIGTDLRTKPHWWSEIYLPGFGWFPVDVSLGAGLQHSLWIKNTDARTFYFGNLDSQHILFSRGMNQIKPSSSNSQTVQRFRSYSLQTIWEEASGKNIKYSSFWADPMVVGVY
ncbi:MAG: hypothetical protein HDR34_04695 [Treponema sp.]|nr:hypothetical protein [Treponema sp.]